MRVVAGFLVVVAALALEGCGGCNDHTITKDPDGPVSDGPVENTNDIGSWLSMRLMPDGRPAIAYYDRTQDALGFAIGTLKDGAVTWAYEEADSYPDENGLNPGNAGKYASMVVAPDGVVWVAYQDTSNGYMKYAKRDTTGVWTVGLADLGGGAAPDCGYWTSIALDASGNPVIAHYDHATGNLRVARWNGSAFTGTVAYEGTNYEAADTASTSAEGDAGEYAKMVVTDDGTEYIAFYDRAWGALRLLSGNSGGYSSEVVDDDGNVGGWPDMYVDGANVTIAYEDVGNGQLKLATGRVGGPWTVETVDSSPHVGADTVVWADGSNPAIAYFDGKNNDLKLARKSGGAWAAETVGTEGAAIGYHNESVEIDGTRYLACYDYTKRTLWFSALP
jgi:hypothetical protein